MIPKIELFLFILSIVFCLKHVFHLIANMSQSNPQPIKITTGGQALLFTAIAYVCTYIIYLF